MSAPSSAGGSVSPKQPAPPKNVAFELLFMDSPQYRARLPMRVQIYPHDATESIVTTVKNFYGLYSSPSSSKGVSFEDQHGNTLIARYENFTNNMIVYVRVIEESPVVVAENYASNSFHTTAMTAADEYCEASRFPEDVVDANSRSPRRRSRSPNESYASFSESASTKSRSRSTKNRASHGLSHHDAYGDSINGYSSGDGEQGSVCSKSKEQLGNTEISLENIVEGGRRKRAKFESSELPLFAPPQMPAATSNPSVSPVRRIDHRAPVGFGQASHNPFTNPRSLHSSQHYHNAIYATPNSEDRRHRGSISYGTDSNGNILPTPDPTVGSCMSEEDKDVAIQLMRLGDMSNISHGRTSASTLDEAFSGKADAASSTGATSDGESDSDSDMPPARRQKLDVSGTSRSIYPTTETNFMLAPSKVIYSSDEDAQPNPKAASKPKSVSSVSKGPKQKTQKPSNGLKAKTLPSLSGTPGGPLSPASAPHSRKPSIASVGNLPLGGGAEDDHPDLSTKPRCQRCRKSKKGCDRQRPCGRCKDAGLSADQCISEDEGNGRKGRYGRHMGVPIKKEELPMTVQPALLPAAPIAPSMSLIGDKSKKRKR